MWIVAIKWDMDVTLFPSVSHIFNKGERMGTKYKEMDIIVSLRDAEKILSKIQPNSNPVYLTELVKDYMTKHPSRKIIIERNR